MPKGIADRLWSTALAMSAERLALESGAHGSPSSCLSHCASAMSRTPKNSSSANNARGIVVFNMMKILGLQNMRSTESAVGVSPGRIPRKPGHRAILLPRRNLAIFTLYKHMAR
jgi:hypothetical protein